MNADIHLNLTFAWFWILLGLVSGLALGMGFHREEWLGGYSSHRRRLYRLGHISFFGLGVLNLCFYVTLQHQPIAAQFAALASTGFLLGAITMPVCCLIMAHVPKLRLLFGIPVVSLLLAAGATLWGITR